MKIFTQIKLINLFKYLLYIITFFVFMFKLLKSTFDKSNVVFF